MKPKISSQNDFVCAVKLFEVADAKITKSALTTGTVTGFLATTNVSNATAADASLVATITHIKDGWWRVSIDGAILTRTLMDTNFGGAGGCFLIIVQTNNLRRYIELDYDDALEASAEV